MRNRIVLCVILTLVISFALVPVSITAQSAGNGSFEMEAEFTALIAVLDDLPEMEPDALEILIQELLSYYLPEGYSFVFSSCVDDLECCTDFNFAPRNICVRCGFEIIVSTRIICSFPTGGGWCISRLFYITWWCPCTGWIVVDAWTGPSCGQWHS